MNITSYECMSPLREECDAVATEPDRLRVYEARAQAKDIEFVPTAVEDDVCMLVLRTASASVVATRCG